MPITEKIKTLKQIQKDVLILSKHYKKRHLKMKNRDQILDFITGILNASTITFIVNTPAFPPLFIGGAISSAFQFVICRAQEKLKWKDKYNSMLTTSNQYHNLANEILIVLNRNHLTNEQYEAFIEEITGKIELVRDSQIL